MFAYGHLHLFTCMYVCMYVCMCLTVHRARRQFTLGGAERVVRRALQVEENVRAAYLQKHCDVILRHRVKSHVSTIMVEHGEIIRLSEVDSISARSRIHLHPDLE